MKKANLNAQFTTHPEHQMKMVIEPFLKEGNPKKVLGMIINIGVTQGGFTGNWVAATVRYNDQGGLTMTVVDPKNVNRLDNKDVVVPAMFNYLINFYEKSSTKQKQLQPPQKEDSLLSI